MKKLLVLFLLVVFVFGCQPPGAVVATGAPDGARDVNSDAAKSPVIFTTKYGPFYDCSGSIETWIHAAVTYGNHNTVMAEVGPDEVLVGGGATVSGGYGLLTGSFPFLDKQWELGDGITDFSYGTKWVAQSKDHIVGSNHYLWVQAIGMKLRTQKPLDPNSYLPRSDVLKALRYVSGVGTYTQHPTAYAYSPAGFSRVISGGAQVLNPFEQPGNFLTASFAPSNYIAKSWFAASKAHGGYYSPSYLISYAICIIDNTGRGDDGLPDPLDGRLPAVPNFGNFNVRYFHYAPNYNSWSCQFAPIYFPAYTPGNITLHQPLEQINSAGVDDMTLGILPYRYTQNGKPFVMSLTGVGAFDCYQGDGRLLTSLWFVNNGYSVVIKDKDHVYPDSTWLYPQAMMIYKDGGGDYEDKYYDEDGHPFPVVMGNLETSP
jgi:hypothetical protein